VGGVVFVPMGTEDAQSPRPPDGRRPSCLSDDRAVDEHGWVRVLCLYLNSCSFPKRGFRASRTGDFGQSRVSFRPVFVVAEAQMRKVQDLSYIGDADGQEGQHIFDGSYPAAPSEVGFYNTSGEAAGVGRR